MFERKQKMPAVENKIKIPNEPIKAKFADIKSEKYFIPSWSFASWKSIRIKFSVNIFLYLFIFFVILVLSMNDLWKIEIQVNCDLLRNVMWINKKDNYFIKLRLKSVSDIFIIN